MNTINKKLNVKVEWEKSREVLKEAETLLHQKLAAGAIARTYYAAFHAGKALLLTEGLEVRSHEGLGRLLSLHFVKTGILDRHLSRTLSKAQKFREEADYSSEYTFTLDDATLQLQEVKELLTAIEKFLRHKGYLE